MIKFKKGIIMKIRRLLIVFCLLLSGCTQLQKVEIDGKTFKLTNHEYCRMLLIPCWLKGYKCKICKPHKLFIMKRGEK